MCIRDSHTADAAEEAVRDLHGKGIEFRLSPDVMKKMGAKDAIYKIVYLYIGLVDLSPNVAEKMSAKDFLYKIICPTMALPMKRA
eukprot:8019978-Heterocapsa_arctica.AAC.1